MMPNEEEADDGTHAGRPTAAAVGKNEPSSFRAWDCGRAFIVHILPGGRQPRYVGPPLFT